MWSIRLPSSIEYGVRKKKNFHLNLNVYRNASFHLLSDMKVKFGEIVAPLLVDLPEMKQIRISYFLVVGSKREPDVANVCCIVDKFFCDVLTSQGKIPDDNPTHLQMVAYGFGGYEKGNGHVEALIECLD